MPCNAAPSPEFSREDLDAVEIYFQAEIDRVTQVACESIGLLRKNGLFPDLSKEAKDWSHAHDAWDAARNLVERSVKVTVRRPTFDKTGKEISHDALCDDDIVALRVRTFGESKSVDQELARAVAESICEEFKKKKKAKKVKRPKVLDKFRSGV